MSHSDNYAIIPNRREPQYEPLSETRAVYNAADMERYHSCLSCGEDIKDGDMVVVDRTRITPADPHEDKYVSVCYWHEACWDAADES